MNCTTTIFVARIGNKTESTIRKIFSKYGEILEVTILKDGEKTHFRRADVIGVLKEELIPQWAADKVAEIYQQELEENTAMEQTM